MTTQAQIDRYTREQSRHQAMMLTLMDEVQANMEANKHVPIRTFFEAAATEYGMQAHRYVSEGDATMARIMATCAARVGRSVFVWETSGAWTRDFR